MLDKRKAAAACGNQPTPAYDEHCLIVGQARHIPKGCITHVQRRRAQTAQKREVLKRRAEDVADVLFVVPVHLDDTQTTGAV